MSKINGFFDKYKKFFLWKIAFSGNYKKYLSFSEKTVLSGRCKNCFRLKKFYCLNEYKKFFLWV